MCAVGTISYRLFPSVLFSILCYDDDDDDDDDDEVII